MIRINNFVKTNPNIEVLEHKGIFTVISHTEDLSVTPMTAESAYYMSQMNCTRKQVVIDINNTAIRLGSGELQMMLGNLNVDVDMKSQGGGVMASIGKSIATGSPIVKPIYSGIGKIITEPTYAFPIIEDLKDWGGSITLDDGMFIACENHINESVVRRSNLRTAVLGGEGLFNLSLTGDGYVCLRSSCPREELYEIVMTDPNDVIKIDGNNAIAWSSTLNFSTELIKGKAIISLGTGEGYVNTYRGVGKILVAPVRDKIEELVSSVSKDK